ncbi:MAG: DUF6817 domain-containing protein [Candidatus Thiodiazotropha endolucinida]
MKQSCEQKLRKLAEVLEYLGANHISHSGSTLTEHSLGTALILNQWQLDCHICVAGLFHAVYGLPGISSSRTTITRPLLERIIGTYAESLVWRYYKADRDIFFNSFSEERQDASLAGSGCNDLIYLILANYVEQAIRNPKNVKLEGIGNILHIVEYVEASVQLFVVTVIDNALKSQE